MRREAVVYEYAWRSFDRVSNKVVAFPGSPDLVGSYRTVVLENEYLHDERVKISIYMSALNVHLNRVPVTGSCGFMRVPGTHDIDGTAARDADHVCTLSIDGHDAVVYVRATPTSLGGAMFPIPVYDDVAGFLFEADQVTEVAATYDYGGNHNNDFLSITLGAVRYTWDHSSYGYGFRDCQPPDCLKREEGIAFQDGCQPERTLPEACIEVTNPLSPLVDSFAVCPGDPG